MRLSGTDYIHEWASLCAHSLHIAPWSYATRKLNNKGATVELAAELRPLSWLVRVRVCAMKSSWRLTRSASLPFGLGVSSLKRQNCSFSSTESAGWARKLLDSPFALLLVRRFVCCDEQTDKRDGKWKEKRGERDLREHPSCINSRFESHWSASAS